FVAEAVPVRADDGSISEWVGTVSDIEDQRQAELSLNIAKAELAKQNRELELIYESAPVGMSLLDREYRYLRVNETLARINGLPREYHIGRRADELLDGLDDQIKPHYEKVFQTGKPVTDVEIVGATAASEVNRTWLASYYPLWYDEASAGTSKPEVMAVSAIVQDITARKLQEERLRESEQAALAANQSKSEFLANMSHEIRTPMAAILGYADVLLGHLKDPDNRNCVIVMKRNGRFLLELINDILDLSRIEAGKMDIEFEPCDLVQLVSDIDSLMFVRAGEKQLDLRAEFLTPVPLTIKTDPIRLRQVLINLVGNAIKFTEKGSVILKVGMIEGQLQFGVSDTGIGMTQEQQDRLFKPFSQGDPSVTRQFGGSGLGLAISRRLTEMLGGQITVQSEEGKGSTFLVTLPTGSIDGVNLVQPKIQHKPASEETAASPQSLHCRVLIVDDRRDVRHISQHFLEKAGASVVTGEDGRQGIDLALAARDSGQPFDVIVMDMQMPNVDGMQATAELRSAGIASPIIALTADAMKGDREKCLNGGCDDYLSKPIDHLALVNMVGRYAHDMTIAEIQTRR
ncbi:MAG: ATP-binding protein, partial [Aureliella sp.]